MSLLTDAGIERARKRKEIIVQPFHPKNLTPIGYDIGVGQLAISLKTGEILLTGAITSISFEVQPFESVLILSEESIHVSNRIGGTFHTMVALVARGLSSISTTLDPGWTGALFITVTNLADRPIRIEKGERLTTLVFYQAGRSAKQTGAELTTRHKLQDIINRRARDAALPARLLESLQNAHDVVAAEEAKRADYEKIQAELSQAKTKRRIKTVISAALILILLFLIGLAIAERGDSTLEIGILVGIATTFVAEVGIVVASFL